jgi:cytochrome c-type biogenesis protein CcmE
MTRKQQRATLIAVAVAGLTAALLLVLFALRSGVDYFYLPSRIAAHEVGPGVSIRLGGLVAEGSVVRGQGTSVTFAVTDKIATVPVVYDGILPELFREGQGIITTGKLDEQGRLHATSVLAKHDETYMPPEVAKALKEQGLWQRTPIASPSTQPRDPAP